MGVCIHVTAVAAQSTETPNFCPASPADASLASNTVPSSPASLAYSVTQAPPLPPPSQLVTSTSQQDASVYSQQALTVAPLAVATSTSGDATTAADNKMLVLPAQVRNVCFRTP